MRNLINLSYRRKHFLDHKEHPEASSISDIAKQISDGSYIVDKSSFSLNEEERKAIEEGIDFLNIVISGENPINGGYFSEDSFYKESLTLNYLRDVCKIFKETGDLEYVRCSEAMSLLRLIGERILNKKSDDPENNDFYGEKARLVFYELAELLNKHVKPLIKH